MRSLFTNEHDFLAATQVTFSGMAQTLDQVREGLAEIHNKAIEAGIWIDEVEARLQQIVRQMRSSS